MENKKRLVLEEVRNFKLSKPESRNAGEDSEADPELSDTITEEWWHYILSQFSTGTYKDKLKWKF